MNGQSNHIVNLVLIVAAFIAPAATAQCVTGVDTGGACIPPDAAGMPGYNAGQQREAPTQTKAVWKDTWGAIAIDGLSGKAGTVTDRGSQSEANDDAMRDCVGRGGANCKVEMSYYNQCAAVGWGEQGRGLGRSPDKREAEDIA